MRNYLEKYNIIGATMCYREGDQCRPCIEWLIDNCNQVILLLDNFNNATEQIVLEYKNKYPEIVRVLYSLEPFIEHKNLIGGQIKKRFKIRQQHIREQVIKELHEVNKEANVDLFIFLDSDELPINQFPKILEDFVLNRSESYLMTGFIEPYDDFTKIVSQKMSPHARVFLYNSEMSAFPNSSRTRYQPYINERGYKVRHCILHLNHFTEEWRKQREFFDNRKFNENGDIEIWQLPKDAREMTTDELADYQVGHRQAPAKYPPILLSDYLKTKI